MAYILCVFTNTINTYIYWQWHIFIRVHLGNATHLHLVKHLKWKVWLLTKALWSWSNVKAAFSFHFTWFATFATLDKSSSFYPGFGNGWLFRTLKKTFIAQKTKWGEMVLRYGCLDNFWDLLFLVLWMVLIFNHIMNWERNTITKVNTPIPPCKKLQKSHSAQLSSLKVRSGRRTCKI